MTKNFKRFTRVLAVVLTLTLFLGNISFAVTDNEQQAQSQMQAKTQKEFCQSIKEFEKFVQRNNDGTFKINGTPNVKNDTLMLSRQIWKKLINW